MSLKLVIEGSVSPILVLLTVAFFVLVLSQFGKRIAARQSLVWWLVAFFLLAAVVSPSLLVPIAHLLGIELVSNMVLATLILFVMLQILVESSETTAQLRKIRNLVSTLAARDYKYDNQVLTTVSGALVVCPCYNEQECLPQFLHNIKAAGQRFLVVDDGSSDASLSVLLDSAPAHFVSHATNIGVAGVLLTGFKVARDAGFDYVVQCDSDGQHPVSEIQRLVSEARAGSFDLLVGSRFCDAALASLESTTLVRRLGGVLLNFSLGLFARKAQVSDPTSGFRVYSRRAYLWLLNQMPDEYPEPESIALLAHAGFVVGETFVRMQPRAGGKSSIGGLKSAAFMVKVVTAIIGLRLRTLVWFG